MLEELTIINFAIIDRLRLRFAAGFNVLTGETGAGKSIVIDAIGMLLGGRAESEYIRSGTDSAIVEGIFDLDDRLRRRIVPLLEEHGLTNEENMVILRRELNREGRNICRVNSRAVPLKILRAIGTELIDIHGQTDHLSLLRVKQHLEFLDRYGELLELRGAVRERVNKLRQLQRELKQLKRDERERAQRIDLLTYQIEEIDIANLSAGEDEELKQERDRLANAEKLTAHAEKAYMMLYEGVEEQRAALDLLGGVQEELSDLAQIDASMAEQCHMTEEAVYRLEEVSKTLVDYKDQIEYNPARLRTVENRLELIYTLKRKYGDTIEEILAFRERAAEELDAIEHSEEHEEELRAQIKSLLREIGVEAERLSQARQVAAQRLAENVERELKDLGMEQARFIVDINREEDAKGVKLGDKRYSFDATGIDKVEFLISSNVGEPPKSLSKTASGGETARLMLAMKSALSAVDETPTLIFDEIDAGVGGRMGSVVGAKLWTLTNGMHQVFCVTHLPQIAGYADAHFQVTKQLVESRTVTQVNELDRTLRVEELALMLGKPSAATLRSAQELLQEAEKNKIERGFN